jgi:hypothetical protein
MYAIDPERLDLAREFKAGIYGCHSDELQRVLNRMRGGVNAGRYVIVCTKRHREWALARMGQWAGDLLEPVPGHLFRSRQEAEWAVFRLRWRELTGRELAIE